jgi:hypothetical protein
MLLGKLDRLNDNGIELSFQIGKPSVMKDELFISNLNVSRNK